ncbi:MAG: ion channel [Vitreoscilla sp.]
MKQVVEQALGGLLMAIGGLDLFVTVLYARIGSKVGDRFGMGLSRWLARGLWCGARLAARWKFAPATIVLSACAPLMLVCAVVLWAALLTFGAALILLPELGHGILRSSGATPDDWITALYVAGSSLSIISNSDFVPETSAMRLLFVANAFIGASALTLTITYVMQIYSALHTRNALGLKIKGMSGGSSNAAELIARWGPEGRFETGYSSLSELVGELAEVHEAHHLYPLLFYFRFDTRYPNTSLYLGTLLEADTLVQCALDDAQFGWLKRSAAVCQLHRNSDDFLRLLERVFVAERFPASTAATSAIADGARLDQALAILKAAGIATAPDTQGARLAYSAMLARWAPAAFRVAEYLAHDPAELLTEPGEPAPD